MSFPIPHYYSYTVVVKIIWLPWKDTNHPAAGGAEVVQHQLCTRLVADGHDVTVITARAKGQSASETINGYQVLRGGNRFSVYWRAWRQYRQQPTPDVVIEEVNTIPFFARFYARNTKHIMLFHQLARQVWLYEFFKPLGAIGWALEPVYLRIARGKSVIAMSPSTKADLQRHGYRKSNISVISEGITLPRIATPSHAQKTKNPSLLAYGSIRPMKRTLHVLRAFEIAKTTLPTLTLTIAGSAKSKYGQKVISAARGSAHAADITIIDHHVDRTQLLEILRSHHYIVAAAAKEGWGLTITEAASQGTPAIAYDVDGQRDAVFGGEAGLLVQPDIASLARAIGAAFSDKTDYPALQRKAWEKSSDINFDQTYQDFARIINT